MAITFLDSGTENTFDLKAWDELSAFAAEATESTIIPWTGARSLKLTNYGLASKNNVHQDSGTRLSFYLYVSALPPVGVGFCELRSTGNGLQMRLELRSTGVLRLKDGASATFDGTAVLSAATWYRISYASTVTSSGVNEFRLFLNGTLDITVSNTTTNTTSGTAKLQFIQSDGGSSFINYVTSIYVDDSSALTDTGDIRVTAKLPASNSTNAWNTNIGANPANRWTNVNERPLSVTNGWEETALAAVEESYGIEAAAAGDVDVSASTIVGHGVWVWAKGGAGGLGAPKIIRSGTDVAVTLTASAAYYMSYATSATYPSGVIGMKSAGVLDTTFLYETGMHIAYTPGAAAYDFTFINPWMIA